MIARSVLAAIALFALQANGFVANGPALKLFSSSKLTSAASAGISLRTPRSGRSVAVWSANAATQSELKEQLRGAKQALAELIDKTNANPILVRLAWHDSGTFDANIKAAWPKAGGAIGSIRFSPEITHGANAGLQTALNLLEPIKKKFPLISYADLLQLASATAIESAGGPKIPMRYGRVDAASPQDCSPEGNLPDAEAGPTGTYGSSKGTASTVDPSPAGHLRKVFYRMGLGDKEIVALSGAHTLGRAWKDRSGLGAEKTKFTQPDHVARGDGKKGIGKAGGQPWTEKWLKFDNSYFTTIPDAKADPELLKLSTDRILFNDPGFAPFAEKYKASQAAFFEDYAQAHKKLSELGSKFEPAEGITI